MKEYETVVVLEAALDDARLDQEINNVSRVITDGGGEVLDIQRWGRRRLAYEIKKKREGIYTLFRYRSEAPVITELDRRLRLNESLLRHLTVLSRGPSEAPGSMESEGHVGTGTDSRAKGGAGAAARGAKAGERSGSPAPAAEATTGGEPTKGDEATTGGEPTKGDEATTGDESTAGDKAATGDESTAGDKANAGDDAVESDDETKDTKA